MMGRKPNIPKDIRNQIIKRVSEEPNLDFIQNTIKDVVNYQNIKQTNEFLAELASLPSMKEMNINKLKELDFSVDAKSLAESMWYKDGYKDPDQLSLYLYMAWGRFLINKGILDDYKVVFVDNSFAIIGTYNKTAKVKLTSDGISIKSIRKMGYEQGKYKRFGSFLIWPCHNNSINQKKGRKNGGIEENIQILMGMIKDFYEDKKQDLVKDSVDIEWMNHLGSMKREMNKFDSFLWSLELESAVYDEIGLFTKDYITIRNDNMWKVVNT